MAINVFVFDPGTVGKFVLEAGTADVDRFLRSEQWRQPLASWEHDVRVVSKTRGLPPKLY